jgi:hypothetical protein
MSPEAVLASMSIVVALPLTLGIGADVYKRRLAFKERQFDILSRQTAERAAQSAVHAERLEQRLRVLEGIVMDRSGSHVVQRDDLHQLSNA